MTRQKAYALIADLTHDEKLLLYELLLTQKQNPLPAEPPEEKEAKEV